MNYLDIYNKSALKIQLFFKLNNVFKSLNNFLNLNLDSISKSSDFTNFKKIIIGKNCIFITQNFIKSLNIYKKQIILNPRNFISIFLIANYPNELLGNLNDLHPVDNHIFNLAKNIIFNLNTKNISSYYLKSKHIFMLWQLIREWKITFENWIKIDKDRTIEKLIISYYFRSEHLDKIKSGELSSNNKILFELENEKNQILKSIKLIDKTFNIDYLKSNYIQLYNQISNCKNDINLSIKKNMLFAYYNLLCHNIQSGNLSSILSLIKDIGKRLLVICPKKNKFTFELKFSDENISLLLMDSIALDQPIWTNQLTNFIYFIIDFIILMDAPINDASNNKFKTDCVILIASNQSIIYTLPKILIQIEEHIDIIYSLLIKPI